MAIQTFTFRPDTRFRAVEWKGDNLEEIKKLAGTAYAGIDDGVVHIQLDGGELTGLKRGSWLSVRDGHVYVSSGAVRDHCWVLAS